MKTHSSFHKTSLSLRCFYCDLASKLVIEKTTKPKPLPEMKGIAFGKHFSDHMLQVDWTNDKGWAAPKISPYGNIDISVQSYNPLFFLFFFFFLVFLQHTKTII
jgi:hypothetical protein